MWSVDRRLLIATKTHFHEVSLEGKRLFLVCFWIWEKIVEGTGGNLYWRYGSGR